MGRNHRRLQTPPLLGEHTSELLETLGFTTDEIAALLETGAAVAADPRAELWAKPRQ